MRNRLLVLPAVFTVLSALLAACDSDGNGGQLVRAPIDSAKVVVLDTNPPRYTVEILAGLPDGCSSPGDHSVKHDANIYEVEVLNRHTGAEMCTAIYGQYELTVALDDVRAGQPYTVKVNDQAISFVAE